MQDAIFQPWPWYVSGPLIGLVVPMLLLFGGRSLGISSSFRHICAAVLPKSGLAYLRDYDWKASAWNLFFVAGLVLGGAIATFLLSSHPAPLLPPSVHSVPGTLRLLGGGVLIGFGTRYAAGCTSGHSIMGLSNLQKASLVATLAFFAGGLSAALLFKVAGWEL
ncbi:MAG: YeeE/YedE thiosulfate transporter family protein [Fibrobacteria bacterium]